MSYDKSKERYTAQMLYFVIIIISSVFVIILCQHLVVIFHFATFLAHAKFYRELTHSAFKGA